MMVNNAKQSETFTATLKNKHFAPSLKDLDALSALIYKVLLTARKGVVRRLIGLY